jgi:hypothetical protein
MTRAFWNGFLVGTGFGIAAVAGAVLVSIYFAR